MAEGWDSDEGELNCTRDWSGDESGSGGDNLAPISRPDEHRLEEHFKTMQAIGSERERAANFKRVSYVLRTNKLLRPNLYKLEFTGPGAPATADASFWIDMLSTSFDTVTLCVSEHPEFVRGSNRVLMRMYFRHNFSFLFAFNVDRGDMHYRIWVFKEPARGSKREYAITRTTEQLGETEESQVHRLVSDAFEELKPEVSDRKPESLWKEKCAEAVHRFLTIAKYVCESIPPWKDRGIVPQYSKFHFKLVLFRSLRGGGDGNEANDIYMPAMAPLLKRLLAMAVGIDAGKIQQFQTLLYTLEWVLAVDFREHFDGRTCCDVHLLWLDERRGPLFDPFVRAVAPLCRAEWGHSHEFGEYITSAVESGITTMQNGLNNAKAFVPYRTEDPRQVMLFARFIYGVPLDEEITEVGLHALRLGPNRVLLWYPSSSRMGGVELRLGESEIDRFNEFKTAVASAFSNSDLDPCVYWLFWYVMRLLPLSPNRMLEWDDGHSDYLTFHPERLRMLTVALAQLMFPGARVGDVGGDVCAVLDGTSHMVNVEFRPGFLYIMSHEVEGVPEVGGSAFMKREEKTRRKVDRDFMPSPEGNEALPADPKNWAKMAKQLRREGRRRTVPANPLGVMLRIANVLSIV